MCVCVFVLLVECQGHRKKKKLEHEFGLCVCVCVCCHKIFSKIFAQRPPWMSKITSKLELDPFLAEKKWLDSLFFSFCYLFDVFILIESWSALFPSHHPR